MTHDNVTDIVERLQDVCLDWDGSQMKDVEEPRNWLSVGEIREAADTIQALRKQLENARSEALEEAANTVLMIEPPYLLGQMEIGDQVIRQCADAIRALKGQP